MSNDTADVGVRGAQLIAKVVAAIEALGGEVPSNRMLDAAVKSRTPEPLAAKSVAALRLADGSPLPPSLAAWLEYDAAWQPVEVSPQTQRLKAWKFADLLAAVIPEIAPVYAGLGESLFTADCYRLWVPTICSEESVVFLYGALGDAQGELPVFAVSFSDDGIAGVFGAGFDVYMARVMDVCPAVDYALGVGPAPYAKASKAALAGLLAAAPQATREVLEVEQGVLSVGQLANYDAF